MVASTAAAAAILLANVPREGEIGGKVEEGEDEGEDVGEDVGGEVDVIETSMNTGSKDTAFTEELYTEWDKHPSPPLLDWGIFAHK